MSDQIENTLPAVYQNLPVVTVKLSDERQCLRPYFIGLEQNLTVPKWDEESRGAIYATMRHADVRYKYLLAVRYQINDDDDNPVYSDKCSIVKIDNSKPSGEDEAKNARIPIRTLGYAQIRNSQETTYTDTAKSFDYLSAEVRVLSRDLKVQNSLSQEEVDRYLDLLDELKKHVTDLRSIYTALLEKKSSVVPDNIIEIIEALTNADENLKGDNPDPIYYSNLLLSLFPPRGLFGAKDILDEYINHSRDTITHFDDAVMLVRKYCVNGVKRAIEKNTKIDVEVLAQVKKIEEEQLLLRRKLGLQTELKEVNKALGICDDEVEEWKELLASKEVQENYPEDVLEEIEKTISNIEAGSGNNTISDRRRVRILLQEFPFYYDEIDRPTLQEARTILDSEHFGLEKAKKRIIDQLAVDIKRGDGYPGKPILLVGPKGIGKTTLGKRIAEATGRPLAYIACGGLSDPRALKGFEATYMNSKEGRIIDSLIKAESSEAIMFLDEIDKISKDHSGNPEDVLMAVTDPEQNGDFVDDFLRVGVSLCHVKFIATANNLEKVSPILLDRFEIIHLDSYKLEEKIEIAKRFSIPRLMKDAGLGKKEFSISEEAIKFIIEKYTNESGVRKLETCLKTLTEITVRKILDGEIKSVKLTPKLIEDKEWLGIARDTREKISPEPSVGEVNGLYWSQNSGGLLKVQVVSYKGKGKIIITGNLKKVMKESVTYAMCGIKSRIENQLTVEGSERKAILKRFRKSDFNIHVPEASSPKDGPSAGVTITTALTSEILGLEVNNLVSMTGEVDTKGNVRPIGGLQEKLAGALDAGAKIVIIPEKNEKDLSDVSISVRQKLDKIYIASHVDEVLLVAIPDIRTKLNIARPMPRVYEIPESELRPVTNVKQHSAQKQLRTEFSVNSGTKQPTKRKKTAKPLDYRPK